LGNSDATVQGAVDYGTGEWPYSVAIDDLDGDGNPDLAVANYFSHNVSVLLGNGDGTFQPRENYGVGDGPSSVAMGDLNGDSALDLATANGDGGDVSVLINTTEVMEGTISAEMTCVPAEGTLPFTFHCNVTLTNEYTGFARRIRARIDFLTAGGFTISHWKAGTLNLGPGDTFSVGFNQILPVHAQVLGANNILLIAADVTPAPYNQPPYPPAGDIDIDSCTVTGLAP
jgi:hypothetical protein